ncbi:hypothetical protein AO501_10540 [Mycobacterium gordonae]|jgi:hypothetical protein|uniref:Uncharacterized protein n=1 Tax=Mycobacterium gordonae TaxID=1778 RepID=A0A0Q2RMI3_MYCGO|nr:hypothetical protein [Mycobacterium]KQH76619.1 hypothetical protein AO501_10540 [Mycobacterium gordonae]MDP7732662.1 hypothetical protein [Mycobacterium sp. TY813]TDK88350.1 hypothetical protein EI067_26950 [Mycobacterium paragordonae]
MPDIDYGLALDFIDPPDNITYQLRFQLNWAPPGDPRLFDGTGQLVAVVDDTRRPDHGRTQALTRPGVAHADVDAALRGWEAWAMISDTVAALAAIRRALCAAGLT